MPIHSAPISLLSRLSPGAVLGRLRELAPQRRNQAAAPAARAANIIAWRLSEEPAGITLRPLLMTTQRDLMGAPLRRDRAGMRVGISPDR